MTPWGSVLLAVAPFMAVYTARYGTFSAPAVAIVLLMLNPLGALTGIHALQQIKLDALFILPLAGIIGLAFMRLTESGENAAVNGFTAGATGLVVASMGIGFGLWWASFAVIETRRIRRTSAIPTHPGWWGFVFPIAAMTLSITAVGTATGISVVQWAGALASVMLTLVWAYVAVKTLRMLRSGAQPPQVLVRAEPVQPTR